MSGQLAVTVLTGSPGNDGSRVFEQLIQQSEDVRLTAIVPKRSKKRSRSTGEVSVVPTTERLVRLGQGCSCCTVRADLMAKVQRIADEKSAEHILIHTSPHADLRTVAKTFTVADESGSMLSDVARIGSEHQRW
ncbi:MAG: GTP-binding protein [Myxococcota bacterium]